VILWTRAGDASVGKLFVEVAKDEDFRKIVTTASVPVSQAADGTCRVLAGGLKRAHVYWFRFMAPDGSGSRIGRAITAPAPNDQRPVRFAFVSCQNANLGAQNAYRRMIYEDERAPESERLDGRIPEVISLRFYCLAGHRITQEKRLARALLSRWRYNCTHISLLHRSRSGCRSRLACQFAAFVIAAKRHAPL
jgi:hypothetical protein